MKSIIQEDDHYAYDGGPHIKGKIWFLVDDWIETEDSQEQELIKQKLDNLFKKRRVVTPADGNIEHTASKQSYELNGTAVSIRGMNKRIDCPFVCWNRIYTTADDLWDNFLSFEQKEQILSAWYQNHGKEATRKTRQRENRTVHLYLMRDNRTKKYKIGKSIDPKHREKTLQSEAPDISLIDSTAEYWERVDGSKLESALHRHFAKKRVRGEWFSLRADDVRYIREVIEAGKMVATKQEKRKFRELKITRKSILSPHLSHRQKYNDYARGHESPVDFSTWDNYYHRALITLR